jgi:hypothetical protein
MVWKSGCLEIHEQLGGTFPMWSKSAPRHNSFYRRIVQSKCHVIITTRSRPGLANGIVMEKTKGDEVGY